jgi:hypothetical protein
MFFAILIGYATLVIVPVIVLRKYLRLRREANARSKRSRERAERIAHDGSRAA